jgi:predicted nucleic-acid-binding Zn-ribbon protein
MKTTGKCPKCGTTQIVAIASPSGAYNEIKVDASHATSVTRYVCTACGYIEQYVADKAGLGKLSERKA